MAHAASERSLHEGTRQLSAAKQAWLERRLKGAAVGRLDHPRVPRRADRDGAPLSFAQRQMWVIDQMTPGNPAYNLPNAYRLRGKLDIAALENSFNEVIKRHDALRTTFVAENGQPRQRIHQELTIELKVTALDHVPDQGREQTLHALLSQESIRPFDLSRLPLIRVSLFALAEDDHVLFLNLHHIVADGWSVALLFAEVDTFYRALTDGNEPHPPDLAVQYPDFAAWQQQTVPDETVRVRHLEFWQTHLVGTLPILELPGDRPRPPIQSFEGSNVFFEIPASLADEIRALGARQGCTAFMTLLAAFKVLLHRYTGAEDLIVGTPVSARTPPEVTPLIGNFLNMAALRSNLAGDPTFLELLTRTREITLTALFNSEVPFEYVTTRLRVERDPSRNPLFQVMLQLSSAPTPRIGNLESTPFHFDLGVAQFDLSLHLYEEAGGYMGRFEYCAALFDHATVQRLVLNFNELLQAIVTNPSARISQVSIVSPAEQRRLLHEWNDTAREYPVDRCVHHLFETAAEHAAHRVAVECAGRSLTYAELNARANRVAHDLIENGVAPGTHVGLLVDRSLDLPVGMLGILKAGAAYVPLDPLFPIDRLAFMMEDAGISVLLTQAALARRLPSVVKRVVYLDTERHRVETERARNPALSIHPSNLAYTIYTSGSTGTPKGVMIEHGAVVNFLTAMQRVPGFDQHDVLVAVTTISFDIAALEVLLPLVSAGRLVIATRDEAIDGSLLLRRIEQSGATMLQATPTTWKIMLAAGWVKRGRLRMLCGGEPLSRELADRLLERGGELWNMYGPTETTIWSSVTKVDGGSAPVLIGQPIANTQFYVVDAHLQPVPVGVPGELLIGGMGVSRGYLNRPDLTAERFIVNPFGGRDRAYRTGDLARFRADGRLEFLGRRDNQVKVRGYRIELGEIECVLTQHRDIKDAVVVTREDVAGDPRLVAYYIPANEAPPEAGELRATLRGKLPEYMVPSRFIAVEAFPLTLNGKIDRKRLPAPEDVQLEVTSRGGLAPRSQTEVRLTAIWERALGTHQIAATDNFFDLGGHSLLAARMFAQIERQMGVKLPLAILFQAPTIRELAQRIEQRTWASSWKSLVPIQTGGRRQPLFLIHAAEGNVLRYRHLARRLGDDQPVYGLQARGLDGRDHPYTTIEEMAAAYLTEIRSVQPEGPYYLGGYCLGGTIAFEIAQQLTRAGDVVALVALFETYNLASRPPVSLPLRAIHQGQNLYFHVENVLRSLSGGTLAFFTQKCRFEWERLRARAAVSAGRRRQFRNLHVAVVNERAQREYRLEPYKGELVLFRTRGHFVGFSDWDCGWGAVAEKGVHVVPLPSNPRGSLNDPFVEHLAHALRVVIDKKMAALPSRFTA